MSKIATATACKKQIATLTMLAEALETPFVVVSGQNEFHHPACHQLPHPKVRTARVFRMTVDEAVAQGMEPSPCCGELIERHAKWVDSLRAELDGERVRSMSGLECLATERGARLLMIVETFFDVEERKTIIDFLVRSLDEVGLDLLLQEGIGLSGILTRIDVIKAAKGL